MNQWETFNALYNKVKKFHALNIYFLEHNRNLFINLYSVDQILFLQKYVVNLEVEDM